MNKGGFSLSRLLGISAAKSKISRIIGIPLTKSGRERKLGAAVGALAIGSLSATIVTRENPTGQSHKTDKVMLEAEADYNRHESVPSNSNLGIVAAYNDIVSRIKYSTIRCSNIPVTEEEKDFIMNLIVAMVENRLTDEEITLTRLSDKTFNVDCTTCYIGKIKLQSGCRMQVLGVRGGIKNMNNMNLDRCVDEIPKWIRYVKYCRKH